MRHLHEHEFRHCFEDTISPMCSCNTEIESNEHFLLRCHFCSSQRLELFDNINNINSSFFKLSASSNNPIFLSEDIIKLVINFLVKSGRFDRPLIRFNQWMCFRYISFHLFVLSNSVKYNSCKFSVAYITGCKSNTYYSFKFIFFFSNLNLVFLFYYLQPTIKLTNTICLVQHPLKASI